MKIRSTATAAIAVWLLGAGLVCAAPAPDSKRLAQAKDYIADEQWTRAIAELQAAANDPKETNRDEALFWLAHSEHQAGDDVGAIQTITRLERAFPSSRWVRPARSLQIEIAQSMRRDDVLWAIVAPPAPPRLATTAPTAPVPAVAPAAPPPRPVTTPPPATTSPAAPLRPAVVTLPPPAPPSPVPP